MTEGQACEQDEITKYLLSFIISGFYSGYKQSWQVRMAPFIHFLKAEFSPP